MNRVKDTDYLRDQKWGAAAESLLDDLNDLKIGTARCPAPGSLDYEVGVKYHGGATSYHIVKADDSDSALIRGLEYFYDEGIKEIHKVWIESV